MNRNENEFYSPSKHSRLLGFTIIVLMILSFVLHFCAFTELFFENVDHKKTIHTEIQKNNSQSSINNSNSKYLIAENVLPCFCILSHLIWIIVPIVILDQCCLENNKSIFEIILKLYLCTCPLLLCNELTLIYISHLKYLPNDLLMISIKWFIFLGTIFISFWNGILNDQKKWCAVHGGQIAPEFHSPLYRFQN